MDRFRTHAWTQFVCKKERNLWHPGPRGDGLQCAWGHSKRKWPHKNSRALQPQQGLTPSPARQRTLDCYSFRKYVFFDSPFGLGTVLICLYSGQRTPVRKWITEPQQWWKGWEQGCVSHEQNHIHGLQVGLLNRHSLVAFPPYQNTPLVFCLIREQQKLLKALEKLDAEPRYSITQSVTTDYCEQWVSQWSQLRL